MENELRIKEDVINIAKEIADLKGQNTLALDLSQSCSWTGYFVISTCSSSAHLKGVVNEIRTLVHEQGHYIKQNRKNPGAQGWVLMDCGDFVVHLMTNESREYYNLEEKWENAEEIYSSSKLS